MKAHNQKGYILSLALGIITFCIFISVYVFNRGFTFIRFSQTITENQKAEQLAYGGIQLAMSQLATSALPQEKAPGKTPPSANAVLLQTLLPVLNKIQTYQLKQTVEGINGTLSIVIGSEEGKININQFYDFNKHQFFGQGNPNNDAQLLFQELFAFIKERTGADLFEEFQKFLKERKYPLNDVTELLAIKGFEAFKYTVFYDPFLDSKHEKIYLMDLFTTFSAEKEMQPWLLSESIKQFLKLKDNKTSIDDALKSFKEQSDWKNDWNKSLKLLYGIDYSALPKIITSLLNSTFNPRMFWVLSNAKVGRATARIFAIVERTKETNKDTLPTLIIHKAYIV